MSAQPRLESKPFSATVDPMAAARVSPLSKQVRGPQRPNVQSSAPPTVIENKGNDLLPTIRQNSLNAAQSARGNIYDAQKMARQEGQNVRTDYRREDIEYHKENREEDRKISTEGRTLKTKIDEEKRNAERAQEKLDATTEAEKTILSHKADLDAQAATTDWQRKGKPLMDMRKQEANNATAMVGIQATKIRREIADARATIGEKVQNFENAKNLRESINAQRFLMRMSDYESSWGMLEDEQKRELLKQVAAGNDEWSADGIDRGDLAEVLARLPRDQILTAKQRAWDTADSTTKTMRSNANAEMNKLLLTAETKLAGIEGYSPESGEDYTKLLQELDQSLIPLVDRGNTAFQDINQRMVDGAAPKTSPGAPPTSTPQSPSTGGSAIVPRKGGHSSNRGSGGGPTRSADNAPSNANLLNGVIDPSDKASSNPNTVRVNEAGEVVADEVDFNDPQRVINAQDAAGNPYIGDNAPHLEGTNIAKGANKIASNAARMVKPGFSAVTNAAGEVVDWVEENPGKAGIAALTTGVAAVEPGKKLLERPGQEEYDKQRNRVKVGTHKTLPPAPTPAPPPTPGKAKTIPGVRVKAGDVIKPPQPQAHGLPPKPPVLATDKDVKAAKTARKKKVEAAKATQQAADQKATSDWKKSLNQSGTPEHIKYQKGIDSYNKIEAFARKHGIKEPPPIMRVDTPEGRQRRYDWYRKEIDSKVIPRRISVLPNAIKKGLGSAWNRTKSKIPDAKGLIPGRGGKMAATARGAGGLALGFLAYDIGAILGQQALTDDQRDAAEELLEYQEMQAERAVVENATRVRGIVDKMLETMSPAEIRTGLQSSDKGTDNEKAHAYEYLDQLESSARAEEQSDFRAHSNDHNINVEKTSGSKMDGYNRIRPAGSTQPRGRISAPYSIDPYSPSSGNYLNPKTMK